MPTKAKNIEYKIDENGCHICTSHRSRRSGYLAFKSNGKMISGHRYFYEKFKGKIPEGMLVRHKCDNRECINPDHLELGTYKDNVADMYKRGRQSVRVGWKYNSENMKRGEEFFSAKLKEKDIIKIKKLLKTSSLREIASLYKVNHTTIGDISQGKTWKHIK